MSRFLCVPLCVMLTSAAGGQPIPPGVKLELVRYLQAGDGGVKANLLAAAERMPEGDYGFKPGSMPEVRTYGQLFAHVAEGQFDVCAAAKGAPNPNQGRKLELELQSKADVVKALTESFAFCDDAFATLTDASAAAFVPRGKGEMARSALLVGLIAHNAEMYGVSTVYLRTKNIVPPSSAR